MLPKGLLKEYSTTLTFIMRILDVMAVILAGILAYFYKFGFVHLTFNYTAALLTAALLTSIIFSFFHVYGSIRVLRFWEYIVRLLQALFIVFVFMAGLAFLTKTGETFSRGWFIDWSFFSCLFVVFFRCSVLIILRWMRTHGLNERRVIIIGAAHMVQKLGAHVQQRLWTGFRIVEIFDEAGMAFGKTPENISAYLAKSNGIDEIWLALPLKSEERIQSLLYDLRHETLTVRLVLDLFGFDLLSHTITHLAGFPTLNLNATPHAGHKPNDKGVGRPHIGLFYINFN